MTPARQTNRLRTWVAVVATLAGTGCWNFDGKLKALCADGGLTGCPVPEDAGTDGGGPELLDGGVCLNGFCWENPLPQGNTLTAVWGPGANEVWVVGEVGTALRWTPAGWRSYHADFPRAETLHSVWGAGSQVWVVGEHVSSEVGTPMAPMHFDGSTWKAENWLGSGSTPAQLLSVRGRDEGEVWASGLDRVLAHRGPSGWVAGVFPRGDAGTSLPALAFTGDGQCLVALEGTLSGVAPCDGGQLELPLVPGNEVISINGLWATATGTVHAALTKLAGEGGLQTRSSGGAWSSEYSGGTECTAGHSQGTTNLAFCGNGTLLTGEPPMVTPSPELDPNDHLYGAWTPGTLEGSWLVGQSGQLYRRDGTGWQSLRSGPIDDVLSLWVDGTQVLAVGQNSRLWTRAADSTWSSENLSNGNGETRDLWLSPSDGYRAVVGVDRTLLESSDGGAPRQAPGVLLEPGSGTQLNGLWGTSGTDVWAVGTNTEVWHRDSLGWSGGSLGDGGLTLWDIDGTDGEHLWAVGDECTVLKSTDAGWAQESLPTDCNGTLYGVWAAPANDAGLDAVAVGPYGVAWLRRNGTWGPSAVPFQGGLFKVWGSSARDIWAVGDYGALVHFSGTSWALQETGTRYRLESVRGRVVNGKLELWLAGNKGTVLHHARP